MTNIFPVSHSASFAPQDKTSLPAVSSQSGFVLKLERAQLTPSEDSQIRLEAGQNSAFTMLHLYFLHKCMERLRENFQKFCKNIQINHTSSK